MHFSFQNPTSGLRKNVSAQVSHSIKVPCADSPRGQPPSQSRLSRTVISTAKASCSVRLLSGDRSREWCWSIGTTDSQSAVAASLTCKPVELPTVSMERLPSAVRARNKPRSFTRLQTRGQLAKGFALDIPSKTRTKFSFSRGTTELICRLERGVPLGLAPG
jgi:hypothetical protein